MSRRVVLVSSLAAVIALVSAGAALADTGGQGTVTMTTHDHDVPFFTMRMTNPCTGGTGTLSAVAANEVFHVTYFTN